MTSSFSDEGHECVRCYRIEVVDPRTLEYFPTCDVCGIKMCHECVGVKHMFNCVVDECTTLVCKECVRSQPERYTIIDRNVGMMKCIRCPE